GQNRGARDGDVPERAHADEFIDLLMHHLAFPLQRNTGADDRTDARAHHHIDVYSVLAQCARYAEMSEAPRATAGQDETEAIPGNHARDAPDVSRTANVVVP